MNRRTLPKSIGMAAYVLVSAMITTSQSAEFYVQAGAPAGGVGTEPSPFNSLLAVENATAAGDTIHVLLPNDPDSALDGGILLKDGQKLLGVGEPNPRITNSGSTVFEPHPRDIFGPPLEVADAVTLADNNEVAGLHLVGAARHAILGVDVTGANIHDNLITEFNQKTILILSYRADYSGAAAIEFMFFGNTESRNNVIRHNRIERGFGGGIWITPYV